MGSGTAQKQASTLLPLVLSQPLSADQFSPPKFGCLVSRTCKLICTIQWVTQVIVMHCAIVVGSAISSFFWVVLLPMKLLFPGCIFFPVHTVTQTTCLKKKARFYISRFITLALF